MERRGVASLVNDSPDVSVQPRAMPALREIARSLSTAWDLDTTLDLIARKTTEVMHVDSCTIYLLDPDSQTLRLRATTGLAHQALGRATLRVGEGMTGYAVLRNRPIYAGDAQYDPHYKQLDETEETAFHSLLAVPLVLETRPIGALNVQTLARHDFSLDEVEMLSLIGDLAAGALAKAQLYDSQRRQIEEMQALAEISEVVTSPQYLDDILNIVTDMAAKMMDAAICSIFLLDETGQYLVLRSAQRATDPYQQRLPWPVGEGVIGLVAASGKPVNIHDVRVDPRYVAQDLARREGLVSLLSVPLSVRDRVIGVFNCYTVQERIFSEEQQALFLTLANQTALAIENARLITSAAVVREMHHRIKNNLQTVAMLMRLQLPDASEDTRQALKASIHRVHSIAIVHDILAERGFRLVDLRDTLERIAQAAMAAMTGPGQDITIDVNGERPVVTTRQATYLALIVNELIQNALDHAFAGRPKGQVSISLGSSPGELVVVVADDGVGMDADYRRGLGLDIVETLVRDELRGLLDFQFGPAGTEATIRAPRESIGSLSGA